MAAGRPTDSSQSNVTLNEASAAAVTEVIVVIHFSRYAGFPSFPRFPLATQVGKEN